MPTQLPPKRPLPKLPPKVVQKTVAQKEAARPAKTFTISTADSTKCGQKFIMYGKSGIGKSSLATLKEHVVFISIDDGARNIIHPVTRKNIQLVDDVFTYQDLRDVLAQKDLFPENCTIVIDTITKVERLAEAHVLMTVPHESGKKSINNINDYGWAQGFGHIYDHMRYLLSDLDRHISQGRNVLLLAQLSQVAISNAEGFDYLEDGPKLQDNKKGLVRTEFIEWADHVIRVAYLNFEVQRDTDKSRTAKVIQAAADPTARALFTGGAVHYVAKTRPLPNGQKLPDIISFESERDNSLWAFLFGEAVIPEEIISE